MLVTLFITEFNLNDPMDITRWIIQHGYILMTLAMVVEGPIITASAALGAALGYFDVFWVFVISFFANFLPDCFFYLVGAWGGHHFLGRFGPRIGLMLERRERVARLLQENVGLWLFFVKTVPFLGPPGIALLGLARVPIKSCLWWDVLIVALTSLFFVMVGYYSGKGYDSLLGHTEYASYGIVGLLLAFVLLTQLYKRAAKKLYHRIGVFLEPDDSAR